MDDVPQAVSATSTRLLDMLRCDMRARGYAYPTERTYIHWIKRFIYFHNKRHPESMGKSDIETFLTHLAVSANASISTQRTALNALVYLYTKYFARPG
jgi:site-specific recombinase XerD